MYSLQDTVSLQVRKIVYFALLGSILTYGVFAWGNVSHCHLQQIINIQNKIIRNMTSNNSLVKQSTTSCYTQSSILPVTELLKYHIYIYIKYYFSDMYKKVSKHSKNTRSQKCTRYEVPVTINKWGERQLSVLVPKLFNGIPKNLLGFDSFREVKDTVKSWLISVWNKP
jgi:hypothetical protein